MKNSLIVCALLLAGCGPTIGLKTDFANQDAEGRDHLFYEGSTHLIGTCVGCGIASAPPGIVPLMVNNVQVKNGAECVFAEKGVLAARFEPKKK